MTFFKTIILILSVARIDAFTIGASRSVRVVSHVATPPLCVVKHDRTVSSKLQMSSSSPENSPGYSQGSVLFAKALVGFIAFAAFIAPGAFGDPSDNAMIQAYIDNPLDSGLNPIFNTEFNLLGIVPIVMACLVYPQDPPKGLSPTPFVASSAFLGYGGLAPYMIFRGTPREEVNLSELGWVPKNVFENKLFNWGVVALCSYQYATAAGPLLVNPAEVIEGYVNLVSTSKFASVSTLDLAIVSATAASLIPLDLKYRVPEEKDSKANLIAVSTLLFPVLGAALYCALRPKLPEQ